MEDISLTNPLTIEEKLQVTRLIGHDFMDLINEASINLGEVNKASAALYGLRRTGQTVAFLTQNERFLLVKEADLTCIKGGYLEKVFMDNLERLYHGYFGGRVKTHIDSNKDFLSLKAVLYPVMSNLIKNSLEAQKRENIKDPITILRTEYHEGFPLKALYIPEGAKDYKNFMAFIVQDSGPGFPKDVALIDRLTVCPPQGNHGFGLYFTGLAAKVMRSPIDIRSEPGNTTVALFHPIYGES